MPTFINDCPKHIYYKTSLSVNTTRVMAWRECTSTCMSAPLQWLIKSEADYTSFPRSWPRIPSVCPTDGDRAALHNFCHQSGFFPHGRSERRLPTVSVRFVLEILLWSVPVCEYVLTYGWAVCHPTQKCSKHLLCHFPLNVILAQTLFVRILLCNPPLVSFNLH